MAKKAVGRTKFAAKLAKRQAENSEPEAVVQKDVSRKTKQKVNKKIQFLEKVEKSGAAAIKKSKNEKKKKKTPLPDLKGLSKALDDLIPEIKAKEEKSAAAGGTKYKRASTRQRLQESEQARLAAIFTSHEFRQDPISAVGNFIENTVEQQSSQENAGAHVRREKAYENKKKKVKKRQ